MFISQALWSVANFEKTTWDIFRFPSEKRREKTGKNAHHRDTPQQFPNISARKNGQKVYINRESFEKAEFKNYCETFPFDYS